MASDILKFVSNDGLSLKDVPRVYQEDPVVVGTAVRQNGLAIRYAPKFQKNREIALQALENSGLAFFWLSKDLQQDDVIRKIAKDNLPTHLPADKVRYTPAELQTTIFFANPKKTEFNEDLENELEILNGLGFHNKRVPIDLKNYQKSTFIRDSRICLQGKHLIPFTPRYLKKENFYEKWYALLHRTDDPLAFHKFTGLVGDGLSKFNTLQAMITSYEQGIPFEQAKTTIEGGNCLLFSSNGMKKALIGNASLYFSLFALKEQGFFDSLEKIERRPSCEAFRLARNLDLYKQHKIKFRNFSETSQERTCYEQQLSNLVTPEEEEKYLAEAQMVEAMIQRTKEQIAEEFSMKVEDLIFIPQTAFHIDMELFITPQGEIVLNDETMVISFLQELLVDSPHHKHWIQPILTGAMQRETAFRSIHEEQKTILDANGLKCLKFPLIFKNPEISELNYCNGIFLENKSLDKKERRFVFISTGPLESDEEIIHQKFVKLFHEAFPIIEFRGIPGMSQFINDSGGGVHCSTMEWCSGC